MSAQRPWQPPAQPDPEEENEKVEVIRAIMSIIVLGLSAAIVAKNGPGKLEDAGICNLVVSIFSLLAPLRLLSGHWTAGARWMLALLTALWLAASVLMFYWTSIGEQYMDYKRSIQLHPDEIFHRSTVFELVEIGASISADLEHIAYSCATFSTLNFLTCMLQWCYDLHFRRRRKIQERAGVPATEAPPAQGAAV